MQCGQCKAGWESMALNFSFFQLDHWLPIFAKMRNLNAITFLKLPHDSICTFYSRTIHWQKLQLILWCFQRNLHFMNHNSNNVHLNPCLCERDYGFTNSECTATSEFGSRVALHESLAHSLGMTALCGKLLWHTMSSNRVLHCWN